jgi:hypothetical protein
MAVSVSDHNVRSHLRRLAALFAVVVAMVTGVSMASNSVSNANAAMGQFCWGVGVGPNGQCTASWGQYLWSVYAKGGQHSGCVNAYYSGSLVSSWVCNVTNEWAMIGFNGTRWMQGTAKNNTGSNNVLYGEMWY